MLHELYDVSIEYKGKEIIKNKVFNNKGKSLKYGKNITKSSIDFPFIYIGPDFKNENENLNVYDKPEIDSWINALKNNNAAAIVCYVKPYEHKRRLFNRFINKKIATSDHYLTKYPFSYQNLFYKLDKNNIKYYVIDNTGE